MEYASEYDSKNNICTVHVAGELNSPGDSFKLQGVAIQLHNKFGCNILLFDLTEAEIISGTLAAYETANIKGEITERLRRLKAAFLYSKLTDHEHFVETVGVNRGFRVKVFYKLDEAVAWLSI